MKMTAAMAKAIEETMANLSEDGRINYMSLRAWLRTFIEEGKFQGLDQLDAKRAVAVLHKVMKASTSANKVTWLTALRDAKGDPEPTQSFEEWVDEKLMRRETDHELALRWNNINVTLRQRQGEKYSAWYHRVKRAAEDLEQPSKLSAIMHLVQRGALPTYQAAAGELSHEDNEAAYLNAMERKERGILAEAASTTIDAEKTSTPKQRNVQRVEKDRSIQFLRNEKRQSRGEPPAKRPPTEKKCWSCDELGHISSECPKAKPRVKADLMMSLDTASSESSESRKTAKGYMIPPKAAQFYKGPPEKYRWKLQKADGSLETDKEQSERLKEQQTKNKSIVGAGGKKIGVFDRLGTRTDGESEKKPASEPETKQRKRRSKDDDSSDSPSSDEMSDS